MKNTELLQNAIGMIGDDLIDDADRKPSRPRVIRWSAVACACLAVIIAVSVGWLWRGNEPGVEPPDVDPPDRQPGEAYIYAVGETCVSSYGTISYQAYEDGKVTLIFHKTDEREVFLFLSGNDIKNEWLDENGKPAYDLDHYYISNKPDYSERGTRIADGLTFIVNGEETNVFPTAPGRYEIVIDYTKLLALCDEMDPYIHGTIGAFYVGEYAYIDGNPSLDEQPGSPEVMDDPSDLYFSSEEMLYTFLENAYREDDIFLEYLEEAKALERGEEYYNILNDLKYHGKRSRVDAFLSYMETVSMPCARLENSLSDFRYFPRINSTSHLPTFDIRYLIEGQFYRFVYDPLAEEEADLTNEEYQRSVEKGAGVEVTLGGIPFWMSWDEEHLRYSGAFILNGYRVVVTVMDAKDTADGIVTCSMDDFDLKTMAQIVKLSEFD